MSYGKLIDGNLVLAPNPVVVDGRRIGNPPPELLAELGYKPVRYTEAPEVEAGFVPVPGWTETETEIVQTWHAEPEGDISDTEALDILMGGGV